uniref:Uncharacterized protein n=1 Tax=mine drainage metagenome TaxID=410659 RepID=E6Q4E7_9ZZZZ
MKRLLSLALVASLAACGGGGGATGALPTGSTPLAAGKSLVKITLAVPQAQLQVHRRSPKYIAPTTKGFGFDFATTTSALNPAAPTVAVDFSNLAAPSIAVDTYHGSNVSCTNNPDGSATCTFVLAVPTSTTPYILQVSTFDTAPRTTGATFTSADLLSQQTFTNVSVAAETPTTPLALVLDGVPASTEMVPLPNQAHLQANGGGYTIVGPFPVQAYIYGLDRDGNVIVGDGAPQICVSYSSSTPPTSPISVTVSGAAFFGYGTTCDSHPVVAQPWTLQTQTWSASPATFTITASAQGPSPNGGPGTPATSSLSVSEEQEIWVGTNAGPVQLSGFGYIPGKGSPGTLVPIANDVVGGAGTSIFGGAVDPSNGYQWLSGSIGTDLIEGYAPQVGALPISATPAQGINPSINSSMSPYQGGIAIDSSERLWVIDEAYAGGTTQTLVGYNLTTSPISVLGTFSPPSGTFAEGVALDPGTEGDGRPPTLWLSGQDASGSETLFAVDISTNTPTLISITGAPSLANTFANAVAVDSSGYIYFDEDNTSSENFGIMKSTYSGGTYTLTTPSAPFNSLVNINAVGRNIFSFGTTYPNASGQYDMLIGGTYLGGARGSGALLDCPGAPNALVCPTSGTPGYNSQSPLNAATTVVVVP